MGGTQTTRYGYTPSGDLATLMRPDGLVIDYAHDAAHRMTGWRNNRGESATYTLDRMGNRTAEQLTDATGAVVWRRATEVNAKNLPVSESVGGALARSFTYDANGDRIAETDALNQTTRYGLDALRRVTSLTDAANATATLGYDATGALARVSDFAGTPTTFARDLEGRVTQLHYNGFRTYDPATGRYTQADPIGLNGGRIGLGMSMPIH